MPESGPRETGSQTLGPLEIGEGRVTGSRVLTRQNAMDFARAYDPQAIHLDDAAAAAGFFGQLTVSGWYALVVTMRLSVEARPLGDVPMIGAELTSIRFARPILPDTEIAVRITYDALEKDKGRYAYSVLSAETFDVSSGEGLIRQRWRILRSEP